MAGVDGTRPLAGCRVVVTRPPHQMAPLTRRLEALGATVVELPVIAVVDPADGGAALVDALGRLDQFDWLVVTSPNGARRVAPALADRPAGRPLVAAVGTATATALGRPADLVPADQIAEGLVEAFPEGPGRVLLAQAADARPIIAETLTARGWEVETVAAYRTAIAPPELVDDPQWQEARRAAESADATLFTSGSAVRGWRVAVGAPPPGIAVAIGPATADVARQEFLKISHVAAEHSLDGVVETLVGAWQEQHE